MVSPMILTTWAFGEGACRTGIQHLLAGASALDAVEVAANVTELDPDVLSVGYGGLPDASGTVTLDAAIMDGLSHSAGAVAALTGVRRAISVARRVMERTPHVILVGESASRFALAEGFPHEELLTERSQAAYALWRERQSSPDVAHFTHGQPAAEDWGIAAQKWLSEENHDTVGLCALDQQGNLAVGCTTSGMAWKVPGRVGDSPILGSGLYVDNAIGAAVATGHGDEILKASLSYRVVLNLERGLEPTDACTEALRYLLKKRPPEQHQNYGAALIALRSDGAFGSAATESSFDPPHRPWLWNVGTADGFVQHEGPYIRAA